MGSARINAIRQRLGVTGMPKDFGKKRKRFKEDKDIDKLVDDITDVVMKERRKIIKDNSRGGRPRGMRKDLSTPLIKEVPFGPETRGIAQRPHGDPENFDFIDHRPFTDLTFEEGEAKAKEMGLPTNEEQLHKPYTAHPFRVIPHGGISIPKEQKRKILPFEKRNWEKSKKLRSRSKRYDQREQDAEEIALDIMNDEKPSRLVNRRTKKIRPPKPVRSDFAEIITAKQKSARVEALRQRLGIKYYNEGQNIIKRTDARPTFLTPEGNYVGKPNRYNLKSMDNYSHSQYIEDIKDPNPGNYPNMGDYTDNPRVLDYMDREDMVRVNSYSAGTDVEVLNEPDPNQIKAIRKIFQEDAVTANRYNRPKHTNVSVWGVGDDGIFQKTDVTNYKDFRKVLKTNEWKNSLDSNMQDQIRDHWLQPAESFKGRENLEGDVPDLHVNRLGRDAKRVKRPTDWEAELRNFTRSSRDSKDVKN